MNARIKACREAALRVLKPSKKELEHGLELHKESLVWDSYGFAPTGPFDCPKIEKLINSGADFRELNDEVEEMRSIGFLDNPQAMREYKEAWNLSGVDCVFQNAGAEGEADSIPVLLKRFARFTYLVDSQRDFYMRSVLPEDVEYSKEKGLKTLYLTINGIPIPNSFRNQKEAIMAIRTFFQLGCRMMHLTYNRRNLIGDGCGEKTDCGLSEFGVAVVKEMNRLGVIPDVAHCGQRTSCEVAEASNKPVVASHSSCYSVTPHCRAKTDEVIRAIAGTNGFIGIFAMPGFLVRQKRGEINNFLDHIDYVAQNFGVDHVAIGTDMGYSMFSEIPEKYLKSRTRFSSLWPANSLTPPEYARDVDNDSLAWTNWPFFTIGLVQRGYSDSDIKKIIGLNVLRVTKESLQA